jgi:hypothetical protein
MLIYKTNQKPRKYKSRYIENTPFTGVKISDKTRADKLTLYEKCLALQIVLPEDAAFSHETAIALLNIGTPWGLKNDDTIHITLFNKNKRIRRPGVKTHYAKSFPTIKINGLRVVAPELLWFSMINSLTHQESIVLGSLLVSNNHAITSVPKIRDFLTTRYKCTGRPKAVKQIEEIIIGTDSPMETRIHLQIKSHELPNFHTNHPIYIDDEIIMLADGAIPDKKICFEYDGTEYHSDPAKIFSDKRKRTKVRSDGWRVIVLTYEDYKHPEKYLSEIEKYLL